jgi:hypothetical protein
MVLYYRLMTKWSGLGDSTELSRMGLSQQLQVKGGLLLDVVISKGTVILKLLAS